MALVLFIDNHPASCEPLMRMLAGIGHHTQVTPADPSALEIANKIRPNLIILGLRLPLANEVQLLEQMRAQTSLNGQRVAILSTAIDPAIESYSRQLGSSAWLLRGGDLIGMAQQLEQLLTNP